MNELTTQDDKLPVSAETLEHVLATGDLSKLTTPQRLEYYVKTCHSLGLNPLTRPMRFLSLNGQIQLYFTRDGTDQLRKANNIALHVVDKTLEDDLYVVTVRAKTLEGREDEDIGAVSLPRAGESRANALMKCLTKAKRRVTLSICGLGQTDESELDTMPGAQTFDPEDDLPVAPIKRAAKIEDKAKEYEAPREPVVRSDQQWRVWLDKLRDACGVLYHRREVVEVADRKSVQDALNGPEWVARETKAVLHEAYKRFEAEPEEGGDPPLPPIVGEDKLWRAIDARTEVLPGAMGRRGAGSAPGCGGAGRSPARAVVHSQPADLDVGASRHAQWRELGQDARASARRLPTSRSQAR